MDRDTQNRHVASAARDAAPRDVAREWLRERARRVIATALGDHALRAATATMTGLILAAALTAPPVSAEERTPSPPGARAYFHYPLEGIGVSSPFKVVIGLQEMGVAPAGVVKPDTGHHHLLIDTELDDFDNPIANDAQHIHLGSGQTEVVVDLPPGQHTLQLVLGDHEHVPHDPPVVSRRITVFVRR